MREQSCVCSGCEPHPTVSGSREIVYFAYKVQMLSIQGMPNRQLLIFCVGFERYDSAQANHSSRETVSFKLWPNYSNDVTHILRRPKTCPLLLCKGNREN
jgi:hypothetical protein